MGVSVQCSHRLSSSTEHIRVLPWTCIIIHTPDLGFVCFSSQKTVNCNMQVCLHDSMTCLCHLCHVPSVWFPHVFFFKKTSTCFFRCLVFTLPYMHQLLTYTIVLECQYFYFRQKNSTGSNKSLSAKPFVPMPVWKPPRMSFVCVSAMCPCH